MVGARGQYDYITMGGMFSIFKVREQLENYDDPGWYKHPDGTVAVIASADELSRDGIDVGSGSSRPAAHQHQEHGGAEHQRHSGHSH